LTGIQGSLNTSQSNLPYQVLTANSRDEEDFPSSTNLDEPYPLEGIIVHRF
jgi:hypothetical protein